MVITQWCCTTLKNYIICYIEMCVAFKEVKLFWNYWGQYTLTPVNIQFCGIEQCTEVSWFPEELLVHEQCHFFLLKTSWGKTSRCIICLVLLSSLLKLLISTPNFVSARISLKQMSSSFSGILIITKDTPWVSCT